MNALSSSIIPCEISSSCLLLSSEIVISSLDIYPYILILVFFRYITDSLWPHGLYSPWNSPGQDTEVGSLSLLQGIFPTQWSNPGLPHCRQILYQLSHKGSPRILEWVTYPFSSGSSRPRNWTGVSCIAGGGRILYQLSYEGSPHIPRKGIALNVISITLSCPALCDPMVYSPPGSSVHGIVQARLLKRVVLFHPSQGFPQINFFQV